MIAAGRAAGRVSPVLFTPAVRPMRRIFALSLTLLILWAVLAELNHALSELRVYVFAGSLFAAHAAIPYLTCAGIAVVTGLVAWAKLSQQARPAN